MKTFKTLINTPLSACQIERVCREWDIRLSVFGWSQYYVQDGILMYHHQYGHQEYDREVSSVEELDFFDPERVADFEYSQAITADMVKALRS